MPTLGNNLHAVGADQVAEAAAQMAFGKPLIVNVLRGLIVETIISLALQPEWLLCSHDYAGWDFRRDDGKLLEVKQSAVRQSWSRVDARPSASKYDIRPRTGRWEGPTWIAEERPRRWADVYVFAHHPIFKNDADHRDPQQWESYVVATVALPTQNSVTLSKVRGLAEPVRFVGLREAVVAAI